MTLRRQVLRWTLANAFGMMLGFLTFIQTLMFLSFGIDFGRHWSMEEVMNLGEIVGQVEMERLLRIGLLVGLPLAGAVVAGCQAWALRGHFNSLWQWMLCAPAGFAVMILTIWPFTAIWGSIPGPVEPFTIVGGGLLASAIFQWLLLRRRSVRATWWLVLWILGLPLGMIVFMFVYTLLDAVIVTGEQWSISWAGEIALYGLCIGGTAAAISGIPLFQAISLQATPDRG